MAQDSELPVETTPETPVAAIAPEAPVEAAPVEAIPAEAAPAEPAPEAVTIKPVAAEPAAAIAEPVPAPVAAVPQKRGRKPAPKITAAPVPAAPAAAKVAAKPARGRPRKAAAAKLPAPAREARKVTARPVPSTVVKPVAKPGLKAARPARSATIKTTPIKTGSTAQPTLPSFKDTLMAKTVPTDFIATFQTAFGEFQTKAKTAYEKSTAALADANDFAKGNVEAVVESSKILASGLQELSTSLVTESRSAFETLTAEVKDIAAVKSPNEFFSLQSALVRKNFDAAVAQATKNTEAMLKLASDAITPLSGRVSLAVEKVSKAA